MFRLTPRCLSVLVLFALFMLNGTLQAQIPEHKIPAVKAKAMEDFQEGYYSFAEGSFEKLMRQFPRDPIYRYYTGICKVLQNKDLEEAAELLYFASTRGVPEDVYYYLGEAYRKLYDFERAKKNYLLFDREAPRALTREKKSKHLVRSIDGAIQATSSYNPFDVLNVTFLNMEDPTQFEQVRMRGSRLSEKPEEFYSEKEDRADLNRLMFMPDQVERGGVVYFAGFEKSGKEGFQIMQARKNAAGKWTDIKAVDEINSEGDEILPYFDPVGKDLYFASNGLEGLGGFDVYKSHLNQEKGSWSPPVNLGFPVNSAFDDYMVLPGTDLGMVMIFSGRQGTDSTVTVYRIQLIEPKRSLTSASPERIRTIANFNDVANSVLAEYEAYQAVLEQDDAGINTDDADGREDVPANTMGSGDAGDPVAGSKTTTSVKVVKDRNTMTETSDYHKVIAEALGFQSTADSLTELATTARVKVRDSEDPNDRWIYQKQIMVWERKAEEKQEKADALYEKATMLESSSPDHPSTIEPDTTIDGMTVYRYTEVEKQQQDVADVARSAFTTPAANPAKEDTRIKEDALAKEGKKPAETAAVKPLEKGVQTSQKSANFAILDNSGYSDTNPIPIDPALPVGAFYRIQLGVYSKLLEPETFKGITPISGETLKGRGLFKYYAGSFTRYQDAQQALPRVREQGFTDAFIVSWFDGTKMSLDKVRNLEE